MSFTVNTVELGTLSPFVERESFAPAMFDEKKFPKNFPQEQWMQQASRYAELWHWYSGDALAQVKESKNGDTLSQYPLHINSQRAFVRKHAAVLFGEVPDGAAPLVKTVVRPRKRFDGGPIQEDWKKTAAMCEAIINEVWTRSSGRAMQLENGKYSQFLGGSVFECGYEPARKDLLIPLVIQNPRPDFFIPEWQNGNYWSLARGSTVYKIPAAAAKLQYGFGDGLAGQYVVYARSFTPDRYTVMLDGQPMKLPNGKEQDNILNPFGVTPSVYIPHVKEGSNYGPTHIEDVASLLKEFNARFADLGVAVLETTERALYLTNFNGSSVPTITLDSGKKVNNLGYPPPASLSKEPAKVQEGTPPPLNESMLKYLDMIWRQMLRELDMSGIPFGEDEGSQRSGQTLALRMWPLLSHTREERTHWNDGLTQMGYIILRMVYKLQTEMMVDKMKQLGISLPKDWEQQVEISVEWSPQIPQDRTQLVMENRDLKVAGMRSLPEALDKLGDVKDVDLEVKRIQEEQKLAADLASQQNQPFGGGKPSGNGSTPSKPETAPASSSSSVN